MLETFVGSRRFTGSSYKAANWHHVGRTTGRGRNGAKQQTLPRKEIFLYPLSSDFRETLLFDSS